MKKVYITPTVFFDEVLDCGELLILSKEKVNDLTGGNLTMGDGSTIPGDEEKQKVASSLPKEVSLMMTSCLIGIFRVLLALVVS